MGPSLRATVQVTLVGTGHIFAIGDMVEEVIRSRDPDVVCVELDPVRLRGLEERRHLARLEAVGDPRAEMIRAAHHEAQRKMPFVYRFLAGTQEKLAEGEGVAPGSEMLAAVDAARRLGKPLGCIDVDARHLIRRVWKEMRFGEKFRFLWAIMRGGGKTEVDTELAEYESDPVAYIARMGDSFPTLKRVLIDERDAHMAKAILSLAERDPKVERVVAVVGDGHVSGMLKAIEGQLEADALEVIRMRALRDRDLPPDPFPPRHQEAEGETTDGGASVSFHVDVSSSDYPDETP